MVKRRSARLQKRTSPAPSEDAKSSTASVADQMKDLPSVRELPEPSSQIPKLAAGTPRTGTKGKASPQFAAETPQNRTPIKPAGEEMHPDYHQTSTAKPLDEARWLGFHAQGARTAPPKVIGTNGLAAMAQETPTKVHTNTPVLFSSPQFRFRFRSPAPQLSPQASRILDDQNHGGNSTLFATNPFTTPSDLSKRKYAVPKSKTKRFSDAHAKQFNKMESIAGHASSFRANPSRFKLVGQSLKRSPSKADLRNPEKKSLKRSPSKAELDDTVEPAKPTQNPLKRTQSKMDLGHGNTELMHSKSTIKLVPPSRDGLPTSRDGANPTLAKRVKRHENDDATSTRPVSRESNIENTMPSTPKPVHIIHSKSGIPRSRSRLFTPTKSSLARSQSVKTVKSTSMIPSLLRSPSVKSMMSPKAVESSLKEGIRKTSSTLLSIPGVKSILRTPTRKFSNDPFKIAAGTHMSPPQGLGLDKALPTVPATASFKKHVNFTASTVEKSELLERTASPSPTKIRAASEMPGSNVDYPTLPVGSDSPTAFPSRRITFGGATEIVPGNFTFESDKQIKTAKSTTIRQVRNSDVHEVPEISKKRKVDACEETSDKENQQEDEGRSVKRSKVNPAEPGPQTPSKLPRHFPKRPSSISKARLNFLATPRRNKA